MKTDKSRCVYYDSDFLLDKKAVSILRKISVMSFNDKLHAMTWSCKQV